MLQSVNKNSSFPHVSELYSQVIYYFFQIFNFATLVGNYNSSSLILNVHFCKEELISDFKANPIFLIEYIWVL